MFNNFIGSLIGSALNYGIGTITSPTFQFNNQISQLQGQLNSMMANQMAMLNQRMLGSGSVNNGFNNFYQAMPMVNGLNSFYSPTISMPAISNNTTVNTTTNTVDVNAQELSISMSATKQDRDKLIEGLIDFGGNSVIVSKDAETQKKAYMDYKDTINKLKDDLKDVPVEALELLNKNGTKIKILDKNTSLSETGILDTMNSADAVAKQDNIIEGLQKIKEANGFEKLDPSVLKNNRPNLIMTYLPTGKKPEEIKGIDIFKEQFINELADVYYKDKTAKPEDIQKFKDVMRETHNDDTEVKGFIDAWKKKKTGNANNPAEVARIDKILALEDMLSQAKQAPVKHQGEYYKAEDYAVIEQWDRGYIESLYSKGDKTMYLKEEVLGKVMSDKDPGKVSVHELGHALEDAVKNLSPKFGKKVVDKVKQNYDAAAASDKDPYNINTSGKNEFISAYSSTSADEYFAETLSAYFYPEKAAVLKQNDFNQYNLIASLFKEFGKAKQMAMQQMTAKAA